MSNAQKIGHVVCDCNRLWFITPYGIEEAGRLERVTHDEAHVYCDTKRQWEVFNTDYDKLHPPDA